MNIEEAKKKIIILIEENIDEWWATKEDIDALNTLLTAYEKEKEENKKLKDEYLVQRDLINPDFLKDYISKDKIKAKIEEYENKIKKIRSKKLINEPEDTIAITRYAHYISVLQSLLEKE